MVFQKVIVIDARGHLMGRLASIVAKEALNGQTVVVTRCEDINISGSLYRNKLKFKEFRRKRMNTNPSRGPYHQRAPAKIFWRTCRGMIPHKTIRGKNACARIKVFEGVPPPYDKMKRMVVPSALRVVRLKPGRRFCTLRRLSDENGWKHNDLVSELETKRKARSEDYYKSQKAARKARAVAVATVAGELKTETAFLATFGH